MHPFNCNDRREIIMRNQFCTPFTIIVSQVLLTLSLVFFPILCCSAQTEIRPQSPTPTTLAVMPDRAPDAKVHDEGAAGHFRGQRRCGYSGPGSISCGGKAVCRNAGGN